MSLPIVRTYFESRLTTWAAAKPIQVAYQNTPFTKPSGETLWLECFLVPSGTINRQVAGDHHTDLGFYCIQVWIPAGTDMIAGEAIAEEIRALFPIVPKGTVSVEKTPSVDRPVSDSSGWVILPVKIPYRYEA